MILSFYPDTHFLALAALRTSKMTPTTRTARTRPWWTMIWTTKSLSLKRKVMVKTLTKISKSKFPAMIEHIFRDYENKPELDRYENDGIDDEEQEIIDAETRRQAEKAIEMQNRNV
jgi:tRNA(Ile)-lysidine synthase TilS/MesJ